MCCCHGGASHHPLPSLCEAPPFKAHTAALSPHITNIFKRTNMAGVSVGDHIFAFDCEVIDLFNSNLSEEELLPLLECFGRGDFTRVVILQLVIPLHCTPHTSFLLLCCRKGTVLGTEEPN
jgi:hypothetical protein